MSTVPIFNSDEAASAPAEERPRLSLVESAPDDGDAHSEPRPGWCTREFCHRRTKKGQTECRVHSLRTPAEFAFQMGYQLREQILRIPFGGTISTYPDDPPYGIGVDKEALDVLEDVGLIEPVPVPKTARWALQLTELGRETVVIIRSTGGKSNRYS